MSDYILDASGSNRHLLINGEAKLGRDSLTPFVSFDGAGDYLSSADGADWDILGNESYVDAPLRGLTIGGWFKPATAGVNYALMTKGAGEADDTSYWLGIATGVPYFVVGDGLLKPGPSGAAITAQEWVWLIGRFTPSTECALFQDQTKYTDAVGIPATLLNTSYSFNIGWYEDGVGVLPNWEYEGLASLCFLTASALPDATIQALYQHTRSLFGK